MGDPRGRRNTCDWDRIVAGARQRIGGSRCSRKWRAVGSSCASMIVLDGVSDRKMGRERD